MRSQGGVRVAAINVSRPSTKERTKARRSFNTRVEKIPRHRSLTSQVNIAQTSQTTSKISLHLDKEPASEEQLNPQPLPVSNKDEAWLNPTPRAKRNFFRRCYGCACSPLGLLAIVLGTLLAGVIIAATLVEVLVTSTTTIITTSSTTSTTTIAICNNTCQNGGTCTGLQICTCPSTYTGTVCQTPVCSPSCQNAGNCTAPGVCTCRFGWRGSTCEIVQTVLWTFDNTFSDLTGAYSGVGLNSPTFSSAGINGYGSALALNGGASQCIYVSPYLNMLNLSFTWEFWVYPTVSTTSDRVIISQCNAGSTDHCLVFMTRNDQMLFAFWADDVFGSTSISANQWSHMAFVFDQDAATKTIYLNGVFEGSQAHSNPLQTTNINLTIGCESMAGGAPTSFYTGSIDQLRYTTRVKNASEILDDATLVVSFPFDGATPLIDAGPNYINGTLAGGATQITGGIEGSAIDFPTNGSFFRVTGLVLLGKSDWPLSLSLWFRITALNGGGTVVHLSGAPNGIAWCIGFLGLRPNGQIYSQLFNGSALPTIFGPIMPVGTWNHAVQTFSVSNGLSLYLNGTLFASVPTTYSASGVPNTLTFGNPQDGFYCVSAYPNQQFYGSIDQIRLYSREITHTEIAQLYANP